MDKTDERVIPCKSPMTAQQMFGALVRAIGLYWVAHGLMTLASACFAVNGYTPASYAVLAAAYMVVGAFLMLKADPIVEMCYAKRDGDGYPESKDPS